MTAVDFLSSMGGLFGLCLGFSLTSTYEIFYWFVIKLGRKIITRQPRNKIRNSIIQGANED
jgi:hypothetical protein